MAESAPPLPNARLIASSGQVRAAYDRLAAALQPVVDEGHCVLIGVLMGGMVPLVHIAERLRGDFVLDYCHATRYQGDTRGGALVWLQSPRQPLTGQTVVLVDDIFDHGHTLAEAGRFCQDAGARRVLTVVLARKPGGRAAVAMRPDFVGMEVGEDYVFGCGMDYRHRWRHLDALWALPPDAT